MLLAYITLPFLKLRG